MLFRQSFIDKRVGERGVCSYLDALREQARAITFVSRAGRWYVTDPFREIKKVEGMFDETEDGTLLDSLERKVEPDGFSDGMLEGTLLGSSDGSDDPDGPLDGTAEGIAPGSLDGLSDASYDGAIVTISLSVEEDESITEGLSDVISEGTPLSTSLPGL